jgi:hypothetical protein
LYLSASVFAVICRGIAVKLPWFAGKHSANVRLTFSKRSTTADKHSANSREAFDKHSAGIRQMAVPQPGNIPS